MALFHGGCIVNLRDSNTKPPVSRLSYIFFRNHLDKAKDEGLCQMLDQKQKTQPLFSAEAENRADKVFREKQKYATIVLGNCI